MGRYVARRPEQPKAHSWYENEPMIPNICAAEAVAVRTGLLDAHGNELWREPNPCGFGRDEEWS